MKLLMRLLAVCLSLFATSLACGERKMTQANEIEIKHHAEGVNSMKNICVRVLLKEGTVDSVKKWFQTLMDRREETLESLRNEGVIVESAFLDRQPHGDFLIYYMRAKDIEKAVAVFQNSTLAIDAYHKHCWESYCAESIPLEQLLDLDTIQSNNQRNP